MSSSGVEVEDASVIVQRDNVLELDVAFGSRKNRVFQAIHDVREATILERGDVKKRRWAVLLCGQAVTISAASSNASSFTLQHNLGVLLPIFQLAIMYIILSSYLFREKGKQGHEDQQQRLVANEEKGVVGYTLPFTGIRLRIPWWIYLCMSILDVEANYMVLLSFQFTSLTSTTLLGSLTVPSVMFFSRHVLARVFRTPHYVGVCLCLLGGTMTIWSDLGGGETPGMRPNSYIGDILAIGAALLYGLGDTVAEYAIKHIDRNEYLGMLGLFGFLISGIQFAVLEREALMHLIFDTTPTKQWQALGTMIWYIASLLFYYVSATYFLTRSDATLLNLSLQTSSLWACLFSVFADRAAPPLVFYMALLLVASGVCVYELAGKTTGISSQDLSTCVESDKLTCGDHPSEYFTICET
jgi:solute carrier family 35 protein F1/2